MNLSSREFQEKRNFIRMRVNTDVSIALGDKVYVGTCHNLSGGGLCVSMPEILPLGNPVEVTVRSLYGHSPVLKASAKVARLEASADSPDCRMGLEIISLLS